MEGKERRGRVSLPRGLFVLLALLFAMGLAYASWYTITTITGKVKVEEAISLDRIEFEASLYPGESTKESFTLTNSSSIPVTVRFEATIEPPGLEVELPGEVEVPAGGQETFDITIKAPPYIEPGEYTIRIDVMR